MNARGALQCDSENLDHLPINAPLSPPLVAERQNYTQAHGPPS